MRAVITINMDGEAFEGDPGRELKRILTDVAKQASRVAPHTCRIPGGCGEERGIGPLSLRDINGNRVGEMRIED